MAKKNDITLTSAVPPALTLDADELRLIMAFRGMDPEVSRMLFRLAFEYERHGTPSLRLVPGGAK